MKLSRTAGTIFQDTRTPLTIWFRSAWLLATNENGLNAKALQRQLGMGSYQTAWAMLHRYRTAMNLASTDLLSGTVEVDERLYEGLTPGRAGSASGGKVIVGVAVELLENSSFGRIRLRVLPNSSTAALTTFLRNAVAPGTTVVTDGWAAYNKAVIAMGCTHSRVEECRSHLAPHILLPGVNQITSLFKRWTLGTHQGSLGADHMQSYLNEFVFRFNQSQSRAPGMFFYRLMSLAVQTEPITYRELVKNSQPKSVRPTPPLPNHRTRSASPVWPAEDQP